MVEGYIKVRNLKGLQKNVDGWVYHGDVWVKRGYGTARHEEAIIDLLEQIDRRGYDDWLRLVAKENPDFESRDAFVTFAYNDENAKVAAVEVAVSRDWVRLDDADDDLGVQGTQAAILENLDKILPWLYKTTAPDLDADVYWPSITVDVVHRDGYTILEHQTFSNFDRAREYLFSLQDRTILGTSEYRGRHPFAQRRDVRVRPHQRRV